MMSEDNDKRERVVKLVREFQMHTIENGCTPGEAAKFAAKAAEWIEKYRIEEAELRVKRGGGTFTVDDVEVCQNFLRTGKKVFNPGMTQVVNGLALGVCCKVILLNQGGEAVYGIIGDRMDADYVCQISMNIMPALQIMARMEGVEHGREKAGLIRWTNQYLTGAGHEIRLRIEGERRDRSAAKVSATPTGTALAIITGDSIAVIKRQAVAEMFSKEYPYTRKSPGSRTLSYDHDANERGREAGKRVGLHVEIGDNAPSPRLS